MKKSFALAPLCLAVLGASAVAAHLTIKGRFTSSITGSDNYFLTQNPSGATLKSMNSLSLDVLAHTPLTDYQLTTNAGYFKYVGPGAQDTSLTNGAPLGATFSITHKQKLTTYQLSASWNRADLASTLFSETGIATGRGYVDTLATQGTVTRKLTPLDSISWTNKASRVSYTASAQTPYSDVTSSASWNHMLNRRITLTQSGSFDWYSAEDPGNTQRLFWTLTTGAQAKLTRRLNFNGSFGVDFSNSYQTTATPSNTSAFQTSGGAGQGYLANLSLDYQLFKETSVTLGAGQNTSPTTLGNLQTTRFVSLSINRQINRLSSISVSSQYSHNQGNGLIYNLLSASLNYSYRLTKHTSANLSYSFQTRSSSSSGSAQANTVTLAFSHDMTVLP